VDRIRLLVVIALLVTPAIPIAYSWSGGGGKNIEATQTVTITYSTTTLTQSIEFTSRESTSSTNPFACPNGNKYGVPFCDCLIATAAFGSDQAPEVQTLREFRDNSLLKTRAGWSFMILFNAWYYSFSPQVAGQIAIHPVMRAVMSPLLYPLIRIISLASITFSAVSGFPELAVFLSGVLASLLIGAFYVGLPLTLLVAKVRGLRDKRLERRFSMLLAIVMFTSLALWIFGELWPSTIALMVGTWTMVLSTMAASACVVSTQIVERLVQVKRSFT
jgi:hypothetical protein